MNISIKFEKNASGVLSVILIAALFYFIFVNIINIDNPIVDRNGFRQTQTALTSYWQIKEGFRFDYLTPVLGKPWSAPFEFPIYQSLVSIIVILTNGNLEIIGKILSLLFSLGTLFYLNSILRKLSIDEITIKIIDIVYITMPTIVFWSGTFMIESTALFFTAASMFHYLKSIRNEKFFVNILLFALFLSLGMLQKITTIFVPFLFFGGAFIYFYFYKVIKIESYKILILILLVILSCAIFLYWMTLSDFIKSQGEISRFVTSGALSNWNYGGFEEFINIEYWKAIGLRALAMNSGILVGAGLIFFSLREYGIRRNVLVVTCIFLFFLPMFIFKPLHRVHDYYQYSNLIFLAVAVGIVIGRQIKKPAATKSILITLIVALINISVFFGIYSSYKFKDINSLNNTDIEISKYIKKNTSSDNVVLYFGKDWSSEIPYYSQRRAVMIPDWYFARKGEDEIQELKNILNNWSLFTDSNYKAMVLCGYYADNMLLETLFHPTSKIAIHNCIVFIR
jgi:4-amino-4-deoxy-L-arabinose transferase-like glycosyltransferase